MSHNNQKKAAVINDFTGFGRCSLTVSIPIISRLKVQCCPVPTSVFSNHTAFDSFYKFDFTPCMEAYINEWKKLGLTFECISCGYLGSATQLSIVNDFINDFKQPDTEILIDPVMGDNGHTYSSYTGEMCSQMKQLICQATIITPNLTEACILTDSDFNQKWDEQSLFALAESLSKRGPGKVVITGINMGSHIGNVIYEQGTSPSIYKSPRAGSERCGTGDIFSAILTADCVNKVPFRESVAKAADFIRKCIIQTENYNIPLTDGVCFEELLYQL